jgi:hypothetical protein
MSSTINASTASGGGVITTADASGILQLQTSGTTALTIDASQNVTFAKSILTSATAQASTSGTSIDFTGIPSWVKRITVMLNGVSVSGTSRILIQLGQSSGFAITGYIVNTSSIAASANTTLADTTTSGFSLVSTQQVSSTFLYTGKQEFVVFGSNAWVGSGIISSGNGAGTNHNAGNVTLSGTLDRVRITTINGTDTFDAGSINIMYE